MIITHRLDRYLDYFTGRKEFIAVQGTNHYYPIKQELNESILTKHIEGIKTFGAYVLTKTSKCNFICIDIDIEKKELTQVNFADSSKKFEYLKDQLLKFQNILEKELFKPENILYEDSGGRGYHIWMFFEQPIEGYDALFLNEILKNKLKDLSFEFFPKQPTLNEKRKYGNLIKLPLGEHKKYNNRSRFYTLKDGKIEIINDINENLKHLDSVVKIESEKVFEIVNQYKKILKYETNILIKEEYGPRRRKIYKNDIDKLFNNCSAINALKDKAIKGNALTHIELTNLSNTLLSLKDSREYIHYLIKGSLGNKYSYQVAEKELKLVEKLQPANCKTLINNGICKGYCKPEFKKRCEDESLRNTSPLHSQVSISLNVNESLSENILEKICSIENIRLAYYRLKEYHKNEDALFYDEFDFIFFEKNFDINVQLTSLMIKNRVDIPIIHYEKVGIPKKIESDGKMVTRTMAYSSVFDQIIAQSIFNIIGEILESNFHENSYGYRQNYTKRKSYNIFEDWREKYPSFRNTVLSKLRDPEIKYYICCDIKGYYDNIRKDILVSQLRLIIENPYVLELLEKIISSYSFDENNELGVPQGPAYARPLANLYLNEFDKELKELSDGYFRYVDDFFVLFDSFEKATKVKEWIVNRLDILGLKLSDDESKKAVITESVDESILQDKINAVRYGIFEDHKFLPNLNEQIISEFYETIIERAYDANDKNKEIPTLIYFGTTPQIEPRQKEIIIDIVEELARNGEFFPKKIKNIFPRLIQIYTDLNKDYYPFFQLLDDSVTKTYFLIAVYEKYINEKNLHLESLKKILTESVSTEDPFLFGVLLRINFTNPEVKIFNIEKNLVEKVNNIESAFLSCKLLLSVDYFKLETQIQNEIDKGFTINTNYLIKKALLSGIEGVSTFREIDNNLFKRILNNNYCQILGECCKILSLINGQKQLLNTLIKFIEDEKPKYDDFVINLFGRKIYERYKESNNRELENLIILYDDQRAEIKDAVKMVVSRIEDSYSSLTSVQADGFNLIEIYNGCSYYCSVENHKNYREILPFTDSIIHQEIIRNISELNDKIIIPKTSVEYNSTLKEVRLNSRIPESYINISEILFSLENNHDCFNFLKLINILYQKSIIYHRITGKIPIIIGNAIVNKETFDVLFTKKGKDALNQYNCDTEIIDSSNSENILKLIYSLIFNILFKTKTEFEKYIDSNNNPKTGIQLFVYYLIKRIQNRNIGIEKVSYLIDLIQIENVDDEVSISYLFFSEKLKIDIFKNCEQFINWKGITSGLIELYGDFALTYGKIDFSNVNFRDRIFLNKAYPSSLSKLSKNILNFNSNINKLLTSFTDRFYLNYFQLINTFTVYCLEIHSVFKSIVILKKKISPLSENIDIIACEGVSMNLDKSELRNLNRLIKLYNSSGNGIFNSSINYSLKEMSTLCLLVYFDFSIEDNKIVIERTKLKKDEILIDLFIIQNPIIEKTIYFYISSINDSLKNYYRCPDILIDELQQSKTKIQTHLFLLRKVQKKHGIKRRQNKYYKNIYKNFKIKRLIGRNFEIPISLINNNPFTDTFNNFERVGNLQYEKKNGTIFNIIIPDKRFDTLYQNLKRGKLFRNKITYIYSGKLLLIVDLVLLAFFIFNIIQINFIINSDNTAGDRSSYLWVVRAFCWLIVTFFTGKILSIDISYWSRRIPNFINKLKGK
jgi:TOTE conflict system primase-like protein/reverse transcriptase-like protein